MKHLFAKEHAHVLAQVAGANALIVFDYDGTLAPIVADRDQAPMRPATAALLAQVAARYPTAVVSGRSRRDVAAWVRGARLRALVGNHGAEPGERADLIAFERESGQALVLLQQQLAGQPGLDFEDKLFSLTIHYRRARGQRAARAAIIAAAAALPMSMRVVLGKKVVNVLPAAAPHKGDAVMRLRDAEAVETVLYVGDDVTDEDVFALDQPGRLVTVRVGESSSSSASYFIRNQRDIDRLLEALVQAR